jgi:hypothetical protein
MALEYGIVPNLIKLFNLYAEPNPNGDAGT